MLPALPSIYRYNRTYRAAAHPVRAVELAIDIGARIGDIGATNIDYRFDKPCAAATCTVCGNGNSGSHRNKSVPPKGSHEGPSSPISCNAANAYGDATYNASAIFDASAFYASAHGANGDGSADGEHETCDSRAPYILGNHSHGTRGNLDL